MKQSITIEVDNSDPNVECCGKNCKPLGNGYCGLFDEKLEDNSSNKIDVHDNKVKYETTKVIHGWIRSKKCSAIFSSFGDPLIPERLV
jgi:hypothetical protein